MAAASKTNGVEHTDLSETAPPKELQADIALLASFLSVSRQSTDDLSDADIAELLRQLETATGVAQGVESRLDSILDSLDDLLETIGSRDVDGDASAADAKHDDRAKRADANATKE
ncbi:hypothetical protein NEOLEDRAFT_1180775 [Neolentinus lepideus HHB14362 ss-1]|uniref:Uncharacterized protein n=1 Tax=Neolentinus lepideus HHB14362 ss-1 TaxID=1314782 RepID=A0A165QPE2_9AGAM|nr:hypothetical protein NEOLEDRAFT_1180775 [Neolentinus lepideus HHB14362 ss-1]